jgi:flavin reductase (DIM6/NTAB) family NADH-FMN oxidoreductase RutF
MIPPVPAILLTVNGAPGDPDEISVVWTFVLEGTPPHVGISVADAHVAGGLIERHAELVLNVPVADIMEEFDTVDMNSSRVGDKFELAGLTRGTAVSVDAPTVEECPIHVECRVFDRLRVPPARTLYVAEVIATTATSQAVDESGRLVVASVPFFGMTAGSGEFYTMGRLVGHIGQTVGRSDIKY